MKFSTMLGRNFCLTPALLFLIVISLFAIAATTAGAGEHQSDNLRVLNLPMRTDGPKSLDPVHSSTVYDSRACSQIYETLLQYKYLVDPPELEPLLVDSMPEVSDDGLTYTFTLKKNVFFQDNPCFKQGKGRQLISADVIYTIKRIVDPASKYKNEWLVRDSIVGLDEFGKQQADRYKMDKTPCDYNKAVAGLVVIDDHKFQIVLTKRNPNFAWKLAMTPFSIVPKEAVDYYGKNFSRNPVGSGPFLLSEWKPGVRLVFDRNPNYHQSTFPTEASEYAKDRGLHTAAGRKLPLVDKVVMTMFIEDQPLWLKFEAGEIDYCQVPAEYFKKAFLKRKKKLKRKYAMKGITHHAVPLLDFIFRGFNMEDEVLGGYTEEKKKLRQAIAFALDWHEFNDTFYNSLNTVYDGMIPPGLAGHPKGGRSSVGYYNQDLVKARTLLAEAGYPKGEGLSPLEYFVARGGNSAEQAEMFKRQLGQIGIQLKVRLVDFSTLMETVNNKKAQFFSFAWGSDYPDGENNLALFYSPNKSPGANHFNYERKEYDELYERIKIMERSPERDALYEQMRDMVLEDCAYCGSMARTRHYLVQPWLKNFKPNENFYNWVKYLDIDKGQQKKSVQ